MLPIIRLEPENRTLHLGERDTLFNISFENALWNMDIYLTIYFMKDLNSEPRKILTTMPTYGLYYYHIKEVDLSDEGYYFALAKHDNDCFISTDTIKVTVIPKNSTSVSTLESKSGFLIHPNPAIDYIIIQLTEGLKPSVSSDVQIFDMLGINVSTSVCFAATSAS
jgi:hypothetical protein